MNRHIGGGKTGDVASERDKLASLARGKGKFASNVLVNQACVCRGPIASSEGGRFADGAAHTESIMPDKKVT